MKKSSLFSVVALLATVAFLFTACPQEPEDENNTPTTFTVTYNGNGSTGGTAPTDSTAYESGATVTVLGKGTLTKDTDVFAGWNTKADGSGTDYAAAATFTITANTTLYAKWTPAGTTFTVTYDGNGSTGGTAPTDSTAYTPNATVTVLDKGTLTKSTDVFAGWNTAANGSGTDYAAAATLTITGNTTLYAKWVPAGTTFTVTYNGNGSTGGTAPTDSTAYTPSATVTVSGKGTLTKGTDVFAGWNTKADGSGTDYAAAATFTITANTTLYAKWTPDTPDPEAGDVDVAETTEGEAGTPQVPATAAVYTITIDPALAAGETLTITNVATADVTYAFQAGTTTAAAQATAIATAIEGATGAKYDAEATGAAIALTAKTAGVITTDPTAKVTTTASPTGVAAVAPDTVDGTDAVKAVYTLTISTALTTDETLTIANVADADVVYTYDASATSEADQAAAIAADIEGATGAKYDAEVTGAAITLTAKTAGAITDDPTATPSGSGGGTIADTTSGADATEAVHTLTISTALADGETLTITNVATSDVVYTFQTGTTTADAQAAAIKTLIEGAAGLKYDTSISSAAITLTAKEAGLETTVPTAAVTAKPPTGGATLVETTEGKAITPEVSGVKAIYTLTITSPLIAGDTLTISNVATANVVYTFQTGVTTADAQAAAIKALIDAAAGLKYDTEVTGAAIKLTAKTAGVIATDPEAEVTH